MSTIEKTRRRLPREERERLIIDEAVRFFAENGFEGQTRALADRLGVTQPLLYRYFPDKDSLIERVFDEVYIKRWNREWEDLIVDRSRPLAERLGAFYEDYSRVIFKPEFVRIFVFAGLKGENINTRYLELVRNHILLPVSREFRFAAGLPAEDDAALEKTDFAPAWALHGLVAQMALRRWVYGSLSSAKGEDEIAWPVRAFVEGAVALMRQETRAKEPAA